jgi:hypothetical protein
VNFGNDVIANFNTTFDMIEFDHGVFANFGAVQTHAVQSGANTVITYDATDRITFQGVDLSDLHASNFAFT